MALEIFLRIGEHVFQAHKQGPISCHKCVFMDEERNTCDFHNEIEGPYKDERKLCHTSKLIWRPLWRYT